MALRNQGEEFNVCGYSEYLTAGKRKTISEASQHHEVCDFLSMSLSLPLYFHPHHTLSQKYTKTVRALLPHAEEMAKCLKDRSNMQELLAMLIEADFESHSRYNSDFNLDIYSNQGAVSPLHHRRHQFLIINTKDMLQIFRSRMQLLTDSYANGGAMPSSQLRASGVSTGSNRDNVPAEYFQTSKWPTRLLALVHPFSMDTNLDENLELFFGLSMPFLQTQLGVQGVDDAWSFILEQSDSTPLQSSGMVTELPLLSMSTLQESHRYYKVTK